MKHAGVVDAEGEQAQVAVAQASQSWCSKASWNRMNGLRLARLRCDLGVVVLVEQVAGHGGHHGAREQIAGQHGEDHGLGQGHKQVARHAAEQEHGHKDDADGERGDQRRRGNLRGAVEDGLLDLLARFEIAVDVFNFDGGVVDQDADGQRQAAEGHDVDGLVQRVEQDERTENRKRNGNRDDERGAPAAQEDQDHDGGEAGGDDGLAHHAADGAAHKDRLIGERGDLELGRQLA